MPCTTDGDTTHPRAPSLSAQPLLDRVSVYGRGQVAVSLLSRRLPVVPYGGNMWLKDDVTMGVLLDASKLT